MSYVQHVGSVQASSPADAMSQATATFSPRSPYVWWVCPASAIFRSEAQDIESMFAPAEDKIYRNPNQYRTVAEMRKVKSSSRKRSVQDGLDDR
jgi:ring-1,2-phenylacetyl-CoA epoxidase subunit PaaB